MLFLARSLSTDPNLWILNLNQESNMYKKFIWIVSLAFSLVFSQTVFADSWGCGEGIKQMVATLKLDDAQKEQISPILDQLKSSMKDIGTQLGDLDTQINQQLYSASMDQAVVDDLIDKKAKLIGDMIKAKVAAESQIFAVLNTQQKMQLQDMIKKLEDKIAAKFKSCHEQD